MKTTVIHHSADYDGIFCREIARKFLPDAELIEWNFGDRPISIPNGNIIVLDLPLDKPFGFDFEDKEQAHIFNGWSRIIWIDHHKSAINTHPKNIPGYRIDGVAACRLAWQWFYRQEVEKTTSAPLWLPTIDLFLERKVYEPFAVRLAGEYDIWDKRDPDAETFQYALRSCIPQWDILLGVFPDNVESTELINRMLLDGKLCQRYAQSENESIVKSKSFLVEWEGLKFLTINSTHFNSLLFAAKDIPETGHDALMKFYWNGKTWTVSLYHAKHRIDLDLSAIAIKYNGGGHKGACEFAVTKLPFLP